MAALTRAASIIAVACAIVVAGAPHAFAQRGLEHEVKAAFLYNFIQFVEWPPAALADASAPFRVCIYGEDPFVQALERTIGGEQLNGHPLTVEVVAVGAPATHCHLLFIPQGPAARMRMALRAAGEAPVLSVGESPQFLRAGGMINLFVEGGRVRFDVNVTAAMSRGLVASSKLLRVARNTSEEER